MSGEESMCSEWPSDWPVTREECSRWREIVLMGIQACATGIEQAKSTMSSKEFEKFFKGYTRDVMPVVLDLASILMLMDPCSKREVVEKILSERLKLKGLFKKKAVVEFTWGKYEYEPDVARDLEKLRRLVIIDFLRDKRIQTPTGITIRFKGGSLNVTLEGG